MQNHIFGGFTLLLFLEILLEVNVLKRMKVVSLPQTTLLGLEKRTLRKKMGEEQSNMLLVQQSLNVTCYPS